MGPLKACPEPGGEPGRKRGLCPLHRREVARFLGERSPLAARTAAPPRRTGRERRLDVEPPGAGPQAHERHRIQVALDRLSPRCLLVLRSVYAPRTVQEIWRLWGSAPADVPKADGTAVVHGDAIAPGPVDFRRVVMNRCRAAMSESATASATSGDLLVLSDSTVVAYDPNRHVASDAVVLRADGSVTFVDGAPHPEPGLVGLSGGDRERALAELHDAARAYERARIDGLRAEIGRLRKGRVEAEVNDQARLCAEMSVRYERARTELTLHEHALEERPEPDAAASIAEAVKLIARSQRRESASGERPARARRRRNAASVDEAARS